MTPRKRIDDPRVRHVLLKYQADWVRMVLDPDVGFLLGEKSRQIGLTWSTSHGAMLHAAQARGNFWYVGYKESLGYEFIRDVGEAIQGAQSALNLLAQHGGAMTVRPDAPASGEYLDSQGQRLDLHPDAEEFTYHDDGVDPETNQLIATPRDIRALRITFTTGFRVGALTSAPKNIRGLRGTLCIDEAAFHEDLSAILKAAMAFQIWGGKVIVISTHDGVENPFHLLCDDIRAKRKPGTIHRVTFKQAVADGLFVRVCQKTGRAYSPEAEAQWVDGIYANYGEDADEELDVIPRSVGRTYISGALVESCMYKAPVIRLAYDDSFSREPEDKREAEVAEWCDLVLGPLLSELSIDRTSYAGNDFGRTIDLSVWVPLILEQDLTRRAPFILELRRVPHMQQRQIAFYLLDRLPHLAGVWMDGGGNGSFLAETCQDRYGEGTVEVIQISQTWYAETLPVVKDGFERSRLLLPQDLDVRNDITAFRLENGIPKLPNQRTKAGDGGRRHGDAGIGIAMAYGASMKYRDRTLWEGLIEDGAAEAARIALRGPSNGIWGA